MKKLLLDECIPAKLRNYFPGHECTTVPDAGWAGKKNGDLLSLAERGGFQAFVTLDQGIAFEQELRGRSIAVILIRAHKPPRGFTSSNREDNCSDRVH